MKLFNYVKGSEEFNDIIDEIVSFAAAELANEKIENKDARLRTLNESIVAYATKGTRFEQLFAEKGLEAMKDPRVQKNNDVLENYNAIIEQSITSILPMVTNEQYMDIFAEIRQIGWGDTAKFNVTSNELYKVNEVAVGVNRGVLQPIYDNEFTVLTKKYEIAASIDFYPVAAGVYDWGSFGIRAAKSFGAFIFAKVIKTMTAATSQISSAYSATGFSNANWTALVEKVSAANGGAGVYAIGTLSALNQVIPSTTGLQYGLGEEVAKIGYLNKYMGCTLIPIDQVLVPGTVNTTATLALPNNIIYFVAADAYKPVKIVFEGESLLAERDPDHTPDRTYRIRLQIMMGIDSVVGSKHGTLTLS